MEEINFYRKKMFLHLDGITIIPTIIALKKLNILSYIENKKQISIDDINDEFNVSKGYLNIAMRCLYSINILSIDKKDKFLDKKNYLINHKNLALILKSINITDYLNLISFHLKFEKIINQKEDVSMVEIESINKIIQFLNKYKNQFNQNQFEKDLYYYLEGLLLGPILSHLGFLNISFINIKNQILNKVIVKIFKLTKLINKNLDYTPKGLFFTQRTSSYGVTTSYLSLLNSLDLIISKKNNLVWERDKNGDEVHVNRSMNVWGSGGAHKFYFKKIDSIILKIFNNENIELQPKGIIDMGCGDGTFLKHCYDLIINNTYRGKNLDKYPLKLIGADINNAARIATRNTLNKSNIDNIVIKGNISDPENLHKALKSDFNENLNDFLSTRTFLDHNRIYSKPKKINNYDIKTTGSFCYNGTLVDNEKLINNLVNHFSNWKKFINKHGLIILELHTIDPELIALNRGKTLACAYDTTHGFSDQYLVEYLSFIKCARNAGINLVEKSNLFPNEEIPSISGSFFK